MHAHEMHDVIHAYEVHAREVLDHKVHACEVHVMRYTPEVQAYGVYV